MTSIDARDVPADSTSTERLAEAGLEYRVVDLTDDASAGAFQRAVDRGFLGAEPSTEMLGHITKTFAERRNIGVYEQGATHVALPVATTNSWVTPLTVPGGGEVDMWAISVVTVAATHRRRGIARALLEGELRAAASAGVPVAGLTVSEATIYGRYGFGSAVPVARLTVDTRRAGWGGETSPGRLEYVDRETLAADLGTVHERARRRTAGQIPGWRGRWEGYAGVAPTTDRDQARGVHYLDEDGVLRGVLAYTVTEASGTFRFRLDVRLLVAETPDARTALWRFALQHDLVDEVVADLRPLDDALPWLATDPRGVKQEVHDHGWLRILDVPAALTARRYSAPLDTVLRVEDSLGFADGDWRLRVDESGVATVEAAADGSVPDIALDVSALSSLYAGGVRAASLHGAGRVSGDAVAVEALDRALVTFPVPTLDIWY
ncbi:MAG: family N-acetyltransferase [Microbacterium sp.]|jgi:predicted acetyltransferase|uniref:GNAT family N-acetyltransferase n=1 Tax=Microbacterium sp. TaxID=51671 RepID=UPI00260F9280|nr:GNAT family N-acetyltransferase [Microbacterium sp.]MDF2561623.1 family N-acetyltransferase [Microbacterium sp.]